ncbi:hypothetical protein T01_8862 [Trichinella spiralis]|uniref:Uncharacterized protein n=1 Tax=Trichinella spiralis TaxID=6334 RepID=A0A0V1AUP5_TRISP|nr:hypothetical protein T01_8862 [Trichinella spiralis]
MSTIYYSPQRLASNQSVRRRVDVDMGTDIRQSLRQFQYNTSSTTGPHQLNIHLSVGGASMRLTHCLPIT